MIDPRDFSPRVRALDAILLLTSVVIVALMLSGCTPVYVDKQVLKPVVEKCRVTLPPMPTLPTSEPMPGGLTEEQETDWILTGLYRDLVIQGGEIRALEKAVEGCR